MFTIDEIIKATNGRLLSGSLDLRFSGISIDSRTVKKAELFIAIRGARFDGHDFLDKARENQAHALLLDEEWVQDKGDLPRRLGLPVIAVENTVAALGNIAGFHRRRFNIPVVAVTGSNGKTSTKEMISSVMGVRFKVLKSKGSFNNDIGVPLSLLELDSSHEAAVLEMGMNHKGEIRTLCAIACPCLAVITNVATAHMEFFNSLEEVAEAKCEMLERLENDSAAVINADCGVLYSMAKGYGVNIISFGLKPNSFYRASNVLCDAQGVAFTLNERFTFRLNLLGEHNVHNALAAIAAASFFKIDPEDIKEALKQVSIPGFRMRQFDNNGTKIIADCYNANPHSTKAALKTLTQIYKGKRKIFVLADMLELGRSSRKFHEDIGESVAMNSIDKLITVGPNAAFAASSALTCGMQKSDIVVCGKNEEVLNILQNMLIRDDVVLFKGSRGMRLEEIINQLRKDNEKIASDKLEVKGKSTLAHG
ncbi:MAG: UDP-N-acetylmuramoyl-tripeptide--D-alanyl-D-alanine ligase [Candidatus Omnitrophica bacterium]|nr:UDP-N-acetylmuramoyl-tripeptide--D-alanyl-D-alanine ligase [Candidatus Omnitrophota bacterium]